MTTFTANQMAYLDGGWELTVKAIGAVGHVKWFIGHLNGLLQKPGALMDLEKTTRFRDLRDTEEDREWVEENRDNPVLVRFVGDEAKPQGNLFVLPKFLSPTGIEGNVGPAREIMRRLIELVRQGHLDPRDPNMPPKIREQLSDWTHVLWLANNPTNPNFAKLNLPYDQLPEVEKDRDREWVDACNSGLTRDFPPN